jgi:hypothetical protein
VTELSDAFGDWMVDTVTVEPATGHDQFMTTFGEPFQLTGVMLTYRTRTIRGPDGNTATSDVQIMGEPDLRTRVPQLSRVTLPDGTVTDVLAVAADDHVLPSCVLSCGTAS